LLGFLKGEYKPYLLDDNTVLFTPFMIFHKILWNKWKIFAFIDSRIISLQINKYIKKNFSNHIINFWIYVPMDYYLTKYIKYDNLIYDYYDNHEYDNFGKIIKKNVMLNEKLAPNCDLINCVSNITAKRMKKLNLRTIKNVNGTQPEIFKKSEQSNLIELDQIKTPIIGYSGVLRNWVDLDLLIEILEKTDFHLVCVGYIDRSFKKEFGVLQKYSKFIHIDYKSIMLVPNYIQRFNVGILPYKINKLTECIYPLKFFEYMAMNIPIVSSPLPELIIYKNIIGYSNSNTEFVQNCIDAVHGNFNAKMKEYSNILEMNTWDKVFELIKTSLNDIYREKSQNIN